MMLWLKPLALRIAGVEQLYRSTETMAQHDAAGVLGGAGVGGGNTRVGGEAGINNAPNIYVYVYKGGV